MAAQPMDAPAWVTLLLPSASGACVCGEGDAAPTQTVSKGLGDSLQRSEGKETYYCSPNELPWKTSTWLVDKSSLTGQCIRLCRNCYRKHQGTSIFNILLSEWEKVLNVFVLVSTCVVWRICTVLAVWVFLHFCTKTVCRMQANYLLMIWRWSTNWNVSCTSQRGSAIDSRPF